MSFLRQASGRSRRQIWLAVALALLSVAAWYATTRVQFTTGFSARYFTGTEWSGQPALVTVDERVSTAAVRAKWTRTNEPFSVRWEGSLRIETAGTYRFSVLSDDGTTLWLDNRLVIDNGGMHAIRQATVNVPLERGVHPLRLDYFNVGDDYRVELLWSSRARGPLSALAGINVSPTGRPRSEFQRARAASIVRLVLLGLWATVYWAVLVQYVLGPLLRALLRHHAPNGVPSGVIALLIATAGLYVTGINWGVPGPGWVPNEMAPQELFDAIARRFSGGWWSWYGPVHYYVLTMVTLPLQVWRWLDESSFHAHFGIDLLVIMFRGVSVAMAVSAVLMIYLCGRYLYQPWPAFVAAAIAAFSMPMVFYAKTANVNVPYLFWFSISLVSFARIAVDNSRIDYVVFAVSGMLAVCVKDQAYGLFGLPALAIAVKAFSHAPGVSAGQKTIALLRDRYVLLAIAAGLGTFALSHNLLFNAEGFLTHFRYIQSGGIDGFRMFGMTVDGLWQLWQASWMLIRVSVGWPAFVLMLAGIALSIWPWERRLWWTLLPAVSYFVTYAVVVRYTYDRFMLPVLLVFGLAAGQALARLEDLAPRAKYWLRAACGVAIAYTFVYVAAVDVAMMRDSRYDVEEWMAANAEPGSRIGLVGGPEYMPRLDGFGGQIMRPTRGELESASFDYIVLNLDWVRRYGPERPEHALFADLQAERFPFRQIFQTTRAISSAGSSFLGRFTPFGSVGYSTLTKINPPLVVLKRTPVPSR